jgi:hypothetical protein
LAKNDENLWKTAVERNVRRKKRRVDAETTAKKEGAKKRVNRFLKEEKGNEG